MSTATPTSLHPGDLTISIVSHGHGKMIGALLHDLATAVGRSAEIIVTVNIPEPEAYLDVPGLRIRVVRNAAPKGFGANHNQAFTLSASRFFAVLNPDIRLDGPVFGPLLAALDDPTVGACGPVVLSPQGTVEDNARRYPSPLRIAGRQLGRLTGRRLTSDYACPTTVPKAHIAVDWLAGMFVLFRSEDYRRLRGFDEHYFMYLEDADICLRLNASGSRVLLVPSVRVVHDAQRASHQNPRYLWWHVRSMARFFLLSLFPARGR